MCKIMLCHHLHYFFFIPCHCDKTYFDFMLYFILLYKGAAKVGIFFCCLVLCRIKATVVTSMKQLSFCFPSGFKVPLVCGHIKI